MRIRRRVRSLAQRRCRKSTHPRTPPPHRSARLRARSVRPRRPQILARVCAERQPGEHALRADPWLPYAWNVTWSHPLPKMTTGRIESGRLTLLCGCDRPALERTVRLRVSVRASGSAPRLRRSRCGVGARGLARREAHRPLAGPRSPSRRRSCGSRRSPTTRAASSSGRSPSITTPVSPSSTRSRTPPTGTVTIAQPAIWASISTPGQAFGVAREDEHVDRRRGSARCRRGARARARSSSSPRAATSRSNRSRSGPSPATTRCAVLAELVHRDQRVERAVGPLLLDQVADETDQPDVGPGARAPCAQVARRDVAVDARRTAPGRGSSGSPRSARGSRARRSSSPRSGVSATAASTRRTTARQRSAPDRAPHLRREAEDALPHDQRAAAAAHEHRGLDRAAAVRDHDVDRFGAEVPAQRPRRRASSAHAAVGAAGQRREVDVFAAVEAETQREHVVGVTERFEPAGELDRDELRAAALAPGHEVQDPHGRIVPCRDALIARYGGSTMESGRDPSDVAHRRRPRGAILVLPTVATGQQGPVAALGERGRVGERVAHGSSATSGSSRPTASMEPDELRRRASAATLAPAAGPRWQRRVPVVAKTAVEGRARVAARPRVSRRPGRTVARPRHRVRVAAARAVPHGRHPARPRRSAFRRSCSSPRRSCGRRAQWGVRRPGWGRWIERRGRTHAAAARRRRGVRIGGGGRAGAPHRRRRAAHRDHADRRRPRSVRVDVPTATRVRHRLGLDDRFVVGWVGSFRRFHALEQAVDALAGLDGATLLLVGDGPERAERRAAGAGRAASRSCAPAPSRTTTCPEYLAAMDVGLVLASSDAAVPLLAAQARRVPRGRAGRGRAACGGAAGAAPRRCRRACS